MHARLSKVPAMFLFALLFFHSPLTTFAKEFRYQFTKGDQFRFISTVDQEYGWQGVDDALSRTQIINRISFSVINVDANGAGELRGEMFSSEQENNTESSLWEHGYNATYWLEALGKHRVSPTLFIPAVRHVPAFPSRDMHVGERWIHPGEEILDFRQNEFVNITKPYVVPFMGNYTYQGVMEKDGKEYHRIKLEYKWSTNIDEAFRITPRRKGIDPFKNVKGEYSMDIYWDDEIHQPAWYQEEYRYLFTTESNQIYVMQGIANAYIVEAKPMNKEEMIDDINEKIKELGINDVRAEQTEDGINLILENIQFNPNSAYLIESEQEKLAKIAQILEAYPDRDLEVVGHTAKAVNEYAAQKLSEQRALSVANFFIKSGVRNKEQIITRGEGSRKPIATNDTPEGMEQNRRVEIKIREN